MDTIFGLPAHILLVHAVVVLCPLAALIGLAIAVRPAWAFYLRWPLLIFSLVSAGFAILAASAGEELEHRLGGGGLIEEHAEAGDLLRLVAIGYLAVAVLAFFAIAVESPLRSGRGGYVSKLPPALGSISRVLLAGVAIWLVVQTAITGHTGAKAAWQGVVESTTSTGGEQDGD